jgi:ribosomal protein S6
MKPSAYLGRNIGSLDFTKFITLKKYGNKSVKNAELLAKSFFEESMSIKQMAYNIEKNDDNLLHIHILGSTSSDDNLLKEIKSFIKPIRIEQLTRKQIIKTEQKNNVVGFKDKWVTIYGVNYIGKKTNLYIENIVEKYNTAYYSNKYNDYGLANGYLKK